MVLPYNNNVPQGSQIIAATQAPILQNTQSIDAAFNDSTNGNFTKYAFQNVGLPTGGVPANPVSILHTLADSLGNPQLFLYNSQGDLPVTPDLINSGTNFGFKLGKMIFNFGTTTILSGGTDVFVTWAIPYVSAVQAILCSVNFTGTGSSGSTASFSARPRPGFLLTEGNFHSYTALTSGNLALYYLAIGV